MRFSVLDSGVSGLPYRSSFVGTPWDCRCVRVLSVWVTLPHLSTHPSGDLTFRIPNINERYCNRSCFQAMVAHCFQSNTPVGAFGETTSPSPSHHVDCSMHPRESEGLVCFTDPGIYIQTLCIQCRDSEDRMLTLRGRQCTADLLYVFVLSPRDARKSRCQTALHVPADSLSRRNIQN